MNGVKEDSFIINPKLAAIALEDVESGLTKGGSQTVEIIKSALKKFTYPTKLGNKVYPSCEDCGYIARPKATFCEKCGRRL